MPSLILENYKETDTRRIAEGDKWFAKILDRYELGKRKYLYLEVIFRQLIMHENMNTGFAYQYDQPIKISNDPRKLKEEIDLYFMKVESRKYYGYHQLNFEKKDRIKSAANTIKKQHADIDKLMDLSKQLQSTGSVISTEELLNYFDELKIKANEKVESKILTSKNHTLKKFIKITDKGEIIVNAKAFDFVRNYSLIMYALMNPYFLDRHDGRSRSSGIYGYVAQKLSFEFGNRLGFHPTAKIVADKIRDNQQSLKHYTKKIANLGLANISNKI